tara:strand:- start:132 stop:1127 length:996 start_codon:yes stop_codon:yes gene_type:complete
MPLSITEINLIIYVFGPVTALLGYFFCNAYINLWVKCGFGDKTATGYGVLGPVLVLLALILSFPKSEYLFPLCALTLITFIYWIDDLFGLSATTRVFLMVLLVPVFYLFIDRAADNLALAPTVLFFSCSLLSILLVNVSNFYDGADLNLVTFILLFTVTNSFFIPIDHPLFLVLWVFASFSLGFSFQNANPFSIYFGDSGSFFFAGVIFLVLISILSGALSFQPLMLVPLFIPVLDVVFVLFIRMRRREDLLSRNYYHLYQRIQILSDRKFFYLMPQIMNLFVCFMLNYLFQIWVNFEQIFFIFIFFCVTLIIYFLFFLSFGDFKGLLNGK